MSNDLNGKELPKGIYQRKDGRYDARAVINGIKIQLYGFDLKVLIKEFNEAKLNATNGLSPAASKMTLDEWFDEWFRLYREPNVKQTSIAPMRTKYRISFGKYIGDMKLKDIRTVHIQAVISQLKQDGKASSTTREALGRISKCLECAKNNGIISINPCYGVEVDWKTKIKLRRFLTTEEQRAFLNEASGSFYKEMFFVMFLTGMRIGEVGALKWEDVDFRKKCINIKSSLNCQYENGKKMMRITEPKTINSYRSIPFMGECEEMLKSQRKKYERYKELLGDRWRAQGELDGTVFFTTMGSNVTRYVAEKEINNLVKSINLRENFLATQEGREPNILEPLYPHAIRHTFCSRCFKMGMHPKLVQTLMGHSDYSTTMNVYTHVMEADLMKETAKFPSALSDVPNDTSVYTKLYDIG